ncbi:hypothetical protein [Streptomyces sp. DSM 40750]|uniref:hypothetical protein n=1 Tax=Streptomyces sp. DSM 40750 TaxID=2801030 RepID=UPI00214CDB08|nr:hypothetical protein [Streptomyces sp. DSM 40750]UUU18902.1 hypothetical protein JIX55_00195 [Streptomyces sp. DSM 40750]UUU27755.1 hypothetical protein JIX55_50550 [Streptomyces sp. DSM 40750]
MRDEQDCPPGHLRRYRSDRRGVGEGLLGQTVQHPPRDRQFIPLGLDLLELLARLFGEVVQFAPAGGDPLPLLHPPRLPAFSRRVDLLTDRRRGPVVGAAELGIPPEPDLPDDLRHGHRPRTGTSTQLAIHTRPVTCDFTMHTAQ